MTRASKRKTPKDVTHFEREQLRFFLLRDDLAVVLADLNPSLAWLPVLADLKLINADTQLARWLERNFTDPDSVRDVVANIHFFGSDTADILEFRFNQQVPELSPLLAKSWRLILRHMRNRKRGVLLNEWFDLAPRLKRNEHSLEVLEKLADVLRPKPVVSKRFSLRDSEGDTIPERPSDLMAIDFEVEDGVSEDEVLAVWSENGPAEIEDRVLKILTNVLSSAAEDAIDAGVESNSGYGTTDSDVPSVAQHTQNTYRNGFLPIVRVIAEIWTRLAKKNSQLALPFVSLWQTSQLRVVRRLALFAAANPVVPADLVADVLLTLPVREYFFTNSSVEVYRLMRSRWHDLAVDKQQAVERRICEGPQANWFKESSDKDRNIDRCRFDLLGDLKRTGVSLSAAAENLLHEINARYPNWELRPPEKVGFQIWHESSHGIVGDPTQLKDVPDDQLVTEAKKIVDHADFMDGDVWQALCENDPARALQGLEAQAEAGEWETWAWRPFLWAAKKIRDPDAVTRVAKLLLSFPEDKLATTDMAHAATQWLNENVKILDEALLWQLWDRLESTAPRDGEGASDDTFSDALNAPAGRLAEILIKKMPKGEKGAELDEGLRTRLDRLITAPDQFGVVVRVRLAADVSFLFQQAPKWTKERLVPVFDWSSPEAPAAWAARKYSYIGSPELFALLKESFLALFTRPDLPADALRIFSEWLAAMMLANQYRKVLYPITPTEVRSVLRVVGARNLVSVAHRLAMEMESAKPEEKVSRWRDIVGPVFQNIWPLDVELQSSQTTFKLVQILRATGAAFPEAADVIVPFIQPDDPRRHSNVYSISEAGDDLYSSSPEKMLDLLTAVVGEPPARSVYALGKALNRIESHAPQLANTRKFQRLVNFASVD